MNNDPFNIADNTLGGAAKCNTGELIDLQENIIAILPAALTVAADLAPVCLKRQL
jgi:hypothetical protein